MGGGGVIVPEGQDERSEMMLFTARLVTKQTCHLAPDTSVSFHCWGIVKG